MRTYSKLLQSWPCGPMLLSQRAQRRYSLCYNLIWLLPSCLWNRLLFFCKRGCLHQQFDQRIGNWRVDEKANFQSDQSHLLYFWHCASTRREGRDFDSRRDKCLRSGWGQREKSYFRNPMEFCLYVFNIEIFSPFASSLPQNHSWIRE